MSTIKDEEALYIKTLKISCEHIHVYFDTCRCFTGHVYCVNEISET